MERDYTNTGKRYYFNTGRQYSVHGQPIDVIVIDGNTYFHDNARSIVGKIDGCPRAETDSATQNFVMSHYDNMQYESITYSEWHRIATCDLTTKFD